MASGSSHPLPPGSTIKVLADDPIAAVDIPHFCREAGHEVEILPQDDGICVFMVTSAGK